MDIVFFLVAWKIALRLHCRYIFKVCKFKLTSENQHLSRYQKNPIDCIENTPW